MTGEVVLRARNLTKHYTVSRGPFRPSVTLKAVEDASFELRRGETLAVVGESGCGKSTLSRMLTMIEEPTAGSLNILGEEIVDASKRTLAKLRSSVQIVFQNPYGSLNPRQKIGAAIEEPLLVNTPLSAAERREKAEWMMAAVGLRPEHYHRYPHMFSGGQRQRIAIARALILDPVILILDEPVSALDISIRAQVLNLITDLQETLDLAFLFISHDLSAVRHVADDIMVMYLGRPVEQGPSETIFDDPLHPYTQALLAATPIADPALRRQRSLLRGELPSPLDPPPGCTFNPRCPLAFDRCVRERPLLQVIAGRDVACHACEEAMALPEAKG